MGKGVVHVDQYLLSDDETLPKNSIFCSYIYHINEDEIIRKDSSSQSFLAQSSSTDKLNVVLKLNHIDYLIDWKKKLVYIPFKEKDKWVIAEDSLAKFDYEFFYRYSLIIKNGASFNCYDSTDSKIIAGHKTIAGYAKLDSSKIKFYYTADSIGLYSPLNFFISGLSQNILSIILPTSDKNYPCTEFTISKIEKLTKENIFSLPKSNDHRKEVPSSYILNSITNQINKQ